MKSGRHAAGAVTEPMKAIRPAAPPIEPSLNTEAMPAITPDMADAWDDWKTTHGRKGPDAADWLAPLLTGGTKVEQRLRQTMRERGLILVNRVSRRAKRLRTALARTKGGR